MLIKLSPQYSFKSLSVNRDGEVLTISGTDYDFTTLGEGETILPEDLGCEFIDQPVRREGGRVVMTLLLPIQRAVFMEELPDIVDPDDGPIDLPVIMEIEDNS